MEPISVSAIKARLNHFSENRRIELTRLVYEIAKRENVHPNVLLKEIDFRRHFSQIKAELIRRRFPFYASQAREQHILPEIDIRPNCAVNLNMPRTFLPEKFCVEDRVYDSPFTKNQRKKFPRIKKKKISSYQRVCGSPRDEVERYNRRYHTVYVVKEEFDFFKACPCSLKTVSCGYHNVNLGSGCAFDCTYCCLQGYINSPGIVLPANLEDFFEKFKQYKQDIRIGSGELTDSLLYDHITEYSPRIVEFFRHYPRSVFEFKTKSDHIENLLKVQAASNVVVAWSLNPQIMIDQNEFYTAPLERRLQAAQTCADQGYSVGFHFDPMIFYDDWKRDYLEVVDAVFERISPGSIAWISLGSLRLTVNMKKIMENRFPRNSILDGELLTGYDKKFRYPKEIRIEMYRTILAAIKKYAKDIYVYLCMEEKEVCEACQAAPLIR
ncbi:MAG: hypothetical protein KC713_00575 [Candidatus Omnitrophica bacterium]|nr:hypothetical protein [Candidatus Omnitrophota bacterium]